MALASILMSTSLFSLRARGSTAPVAQQTVPCTWQIVPTPNRNSDELYNLLWDIAVVSPDDAWAIGAAYVPGEGGRWRSVILRWDGSRWRAVRNPTPRSCCLAAIAAASSSDAWAVGGSGLGGLIVRWDGTEWRRSRPADPGNRSWFFNDVAALSPTDVWAVGTQVGKGFSSTLIEHWDGTRWSIVPSPEPPLASPGALSAGSTAVAGSSSTDVWAVGTWNLGCPSSACSGAVYHTLADRWDGESWRIVPMPDAPSAAGLNTGLVAVSASGPSDAWAVGWGVDGSWIERWDGSSWTVVPAPSSTGRTDLFGVAAVSPGAAWAVGSAGEAPATPLIERWDGLSWSVDPTPDARSSWLSDVAAGPDGDLWAVGARGRSPQRALAMRCS